MKHKNMKNISKDEIMELRKKGYTIMDMAEYFDCSKGKIDYLIRQYGIGKSYKTYDKNKLLTIAKDYTVRELANMYNTSERQIRMWLDDLGIKAKKSEVTRRKELDVNFISQQMRMGYTADEIGEKLGVCGTTVLRRLHEAGADVSGLQDVAKWKKEIKEYYGIAPETDDKPGTIGKNCMSKRQYSCKYCSSGDCMYLVVEGCRRQSPPWNCQQYTRRKKGERTVYS